LVCAGASVPIAVSKADSKSAEIVVFFMIIGFYQVVVRKYIGI